MAEVKPQPLIAEFGWARDLIISKHSKGETIGVATYRVVRAVPAERRGELPAPEQIAKLLEGME